MPYYRSRSRYGGYGAHRRLLWNEPRERIASSTRSEVYSKSGLVCHLCGASIPTQASYPNPFTRSVDHIIPVSKGGSDGLDNLAPAHLKCNSDRGNLRLPEYRCRQVSRGVRPFRYHRIIAKATPVRIGQKYFQPLVNDYQRRKALKAQAQTFLLGLLILVAVLAVGFILFKFTAKVVIVTVWALFVLWLYSKTPYAQRQRAWKAKKKSRFNTDKEYSRSPIKKYLNRRVFEWVEMDTPPENFVSVRQRRTSPARRFPSQ